MGMEMDVGEDGVELEVARNGGELEVEEEHIEGGSGRRRRWEWRRRIVQRCYGRRRGGQM